MPARFLDLEKTFLSSHWRIPAVVEIRFSSQPNGVKQSLAVYRIDTAALSDEIHALAPRRRRKRRVNRKPV